MIQLRLSNLRALFRKFQPPAASGRAAGFWSNRRVAVVSFLAALPAAWMLEPLLPSAAVQSEARKEKPAALVDGEPIYASEFLPQIAAKIYQAQRQEYEVKRKALEEVINKRLLKAEAEAFGMTEEELLRQEVDSRVPEPSDSEVEQRFVMLMFRGGGQIAETKEDVREQLKQAKLEAARQSYYRMLREKGHVKILLLPPALEVDWDPGRVRGNPDAKITMVEFSDFQCPYCEQAYFMVKRLLEKYDGKLKLAYRDLPLQEINSGTPGAAEASRCAGEQGKFWEYHDLLFEHQDEYGEDAFQMLAE
ncbi:MAG TPA: thioredoxin domain-containing protein, partial [Terriglobia bacterium]|nr:thioredoxin domain-containing protein [Terriglobia bacterium]